MDSIEPRGFLVRQSLPVACLCAVALIAPGRLARAQSETDPDPPTRLDEDAEKEGSPSLGYDGGFFIESSDERFELKINGRVQGRFAFESVEEHVEAPSSGDEPSDAATGEASATRRREEDYAFSIPRARLKLKGHAFSEDLSYLMQVEFGKGFAYLKDYYVDAGLVSGKLHLRIGQYKRPFSRQQITSSGKLELVDRSITDKAFGAGRDIGLMFHNRPTKSPPFEWAIGVFNGTGEKPWFEGEVLVDTESGEGEVTKAEHTNVPDRFRPAAVARIGYNYGDLKGYSEADLEGGGPRFGIGASGIAEFDSDGDDDSSIRGEIDYVLKLHGFSTSGAFFAGSAQDGNDFQDQSFAALGFYTQAGFVFGDFIQPAVRYTIVDPDGEENGSQHILGSLSFYFFGHNVKWQTDGGAVLREVEAGDATDYMVRTQLQLAF
jgi:phosphate-selective porin OprO and OprP